jgi:protein-disulfide isomerase
MTCPHCAHFSNTAKAQVAARVRTGRVSYEFRNFVLNGIDVAATLLARCAAPTSFFPLTEKLYATQQQWAGRIGGLSTAEKDQLRTLPEAELFAKIADLGGLTQLAAEAGVTPQRAKACLVDPAGLARLDQLAEAGRALGVQGTPTFFVNGKMISTQEWADIEPLITQAGG